MQTLKDQGDALIFVSKNTFKPIRYPSTIKQLRVIAKRAGVTKHIRGHIFRHSRITYLLQQGVSESIVKKMMWGGESRMIERYAHLTDEDTGRTMAELAGVTQPGKKKRAKALEPVQCPRCAIIDGPTDNFCRKCGLALTEEETAEVDSISADVRKLMANDAGLLRQAAEMLQRGMSAAKRSYGRRYMCLAGAPRPSEEIF